MILISCAKVNQAVTTWCCCIRTCFFLSKVELLQHRACCWRGRTAETRSFLWDMLTFKDNSSLFSNVGAHTLDHASFSSTVFTWSNICLQNSQNHVWPHPSCGSACPSNCWCEKRALWKLNCQPLIITLQDSSQRRGLSPVTAGLEWRCWNGR